MIQTKQKITKDFKKLTSSLSEEMQLAIADWWLIQRELELKELMEKIHKILKEAQSLPKYRFNKSGGDRIPYIWLEIDKIITNKLK